MLQSVSYNSAEPTFNGYINDHTSAASPDISGDWDNGVGAFPDGPYINRADEGGYQYPNYGVGNNSPVPYFGGNGGSQAEGVKYNSPNRVMASPVTFGSLPTGVPINGLPAHPWQTLLFRPQPGHPGAASPEDELLLDWFWMRWSIPTRSAPRWPPRAR
ncbi:MAG: hypothetical protein WDO13_21425 [Verrucomicrobiota bacterium]